MENKVKKNLVVAKDIPTQLSSVQPPSDAGFWLYASREIVDSVGDLVSIDGMDTDVYHNPPETHLKILAQHTYYTADLTPAVVALVKDIVRTTTVYKGTFVKTLALWCEWVADPETKELLPLAKIYKQHMAAGAIDSGSVGMMVKSYSEMDNGGMFLAETTLYETSLVTIPCNAAANVVKELEATGITVKEFSKDTDPDPVVPEPVTNTYTTGSGSIDEDPIPSDEIDRASKILEGILVNSMKTHTNSILLAINGVMDEIKKCNETQMEIESKMALAHNAGQQQSHTEKTTSIPDLSEVKNALDKVNSLFTK